MSRAEADARLSNRSTAVSRSPITGAGHLFSPRILCTKTSKPQARSDYSSHFVRAGRNGADVWPAHRFMAGHPDRGPCKYQGGPAHEIQGLLDSKELMKPMVELGIFTADGKDWQHSRAMLRPNFVKDQVADLRSFEDHIQDLLKLIPRDGSTVELQQIFRRSTLDSATEFLFGHSTHASKSGRSRQVV
jgi:hypothetical protein